MSASLVVRRRALRSYAALGAGSMAGEVSPQLRMQWLLDALNDNLCMARRAVVEGLGHERTQPLTKACMIIAGLYQALDGRRSHGTANRLGDIYRYLLSRINRVNKRNGEKILNELIGLVSTMRSAWGVSVQKPN